MIGAATEKSLDLSSKIAPVGVSAVGADPVVNAILDELHRICVHEAGHFVIGGQWASDCQAEVWPLPPPEATFEDTLVLGRCRYTFPDGVLTAHRARLIAVAGAVAEALRWITVPEALRLIAVPADLFLDPPPRVWERMSSNDRTLSGLIEDESFDLIGLAQAIAEASALLLGPLAGKHREAAVSL